MGLRSILAATLKGKVLAVVLVGTAVVGGGTVAMASTPTKALLTNQTAIAAKTVTPTAHAENKDRGTATPEATPHGNDQQHDKDQKDDHSQQCAGLPEIQRLATQFSLSTESTSDDVKTLCSLHDGTFKGTTTSGKTVSTSTVYGYGEINQLLTAAQHLAGHDRGKLTSDNARSYIANVLSGCGTTQLEVCLKASTPVTHPGNSNNPGNGNNPGSNKGKPASTPTAKH
ncbi:MAG TPA: hypothetical protein VL485_17840 [Ktedonobacteraceae bacterium]|jgi:hypothetical protein|nr:hypothetical protein [Ktedonobacteraceae bacterium]